MCKRNRKLITALTLLACSGYAGVSHGADGTITFTGELGGECSVGSYTESVDFGRVSTADFNTVNSESDTQNFTIGILCTDTDTLPSLTFEGEIDSAYSLGFANTGGSAEGIAARLIYNGNTIRPNEVTPLTNVTTADEAQTFTFGSRLRRTGDMVKGTIEIPVTFTLSFE
ncbi:fimbrial protein [Enterobacter pseudoroggenkampii]|uniref:fimbrial protein n=1 Tax=Enterobacter pseudoroggenkampii TaxID=2996112 RepID=UPI0038B23DC3